MRKSENTIEDDSSQYAAEMNLRVSSIEKAISDVRRQQDAINEMLLDQIRKGFFDSSQSSRLLVPVQLKYSLDGLPPTASNFHPLEVSKDGASYRWTGPGTTIELPIVVDRQKNYMATLHVVAIAAQSVMDATEIYVDGSLVECVKDGKRITFEIPSDSARYNEATIRIMTGDCIVPASLPESQSRDTRKLGIAISGLEIK